MENGMYGWLTPSGDFYPCSPGSHGETANDIILGCEARGERIKGHYVVLSIGFLSIPPTFTEQQATFLADNFEKLDCDQQQQLLEFGEPAGFIYPF